MNIFIAENIPLLPETLVRCGKITMFDSKKLSNQDLIEGSCDILIVRSTIKVNKSLLEGSSVKFVGTATSGTDHIDLDYLREHQIIFAEAKGSNANSVAEYVVYAILSWAEKINTSLSGNTIGIIGFGSVGKIVARLANYFGMHILVNDPPLKDEGFEFPDFTEYAELDNLCTNSQIITNHVPLTKSGRYPTYNLLDESKINIIDEDCLFIHTSRGGVVSESALIKQFKMQKLFTAVDVWENEPDFNTDLARIAMLSTPHIAGHAFEGKLRGSVMMAEALKEYFDIKPDISFLNNALSHYYPLGPEFYINENSILQKLQASRDFQTIHNQFLNLIKLPKNERIEGFINFRKNFPIQHEIL